MAAVSPSGLSSFGLREIKKVNLPMPAAKSRACAIIAELGQAQVELIGKAVILTNGTAGTVDNVRLDEFHGLRISIRGHEGQWPVSTIKKAHT